MGDRLVTCDVVRPDLARMPRVAELGLACASVIADGVGGDCPGWCLALASGDLLPLDEDPGVIAVFPIPDMERDELLLLLKQSPDELGWTAEQLDYAYQRIIERGGTVDGLPPNTPLIEFVTTLTTLLGQRGADLRNLWSG